MNSSSMIIKATGFALGGYVVARLTGASPFLTGSGFAIAYLVDSIFFAVIERMYKSDENGAKKNALYIGWYFLGGFAAIAGCKQAGIISLVGVGIFSSLLLVATTLALYRHIGERKFVYVNKEWYS